MHVTCLARWSGLLVLAVGVWLFESVSAAPVATDPDRQEPPAEKIRKALDQNTSYNVNGVPLGQAVTHVCEQLKIPAAFENLVLENFHIRVPVAGNPGALQSVAVKEAPVSVKLENVKGRQVLRAILTPYGLDFAIVDGTLLITTQGRPHDLQLGQRVSLDLNEVSLKAALKQLARDTGAQIIIAPQAAKEAQVGVTLTLNEVPLSTAVILITETAGLTMLRMDNLLYVTTEERAQRLRTISGQWGNSNLPPRPVGRLQYGPADLQAPNNPEFGGFGRGKGKGARAQ